MLTIIICLNIFTVVQSLKLIVNKMNITYVNHKYLESLDLFVKRYGRRSDYYLNLKGKKYHTWGNNVTFHLIFYEYLHNEYRRSFVELHYGICDLLNYDILIGQMLKKYNPICPIVRNDLEMLNVTVPVNFRYKFPFEQFRIDGYVDCTDTKEVITTALVFGVLKS